MRVSFCSVPKKNCLQAAVAIASCCLHHHCHLPRPDSRCDSVEKDIRCPFKIIAVVAKILKTAEAEEESAIANEIIVGVNGVL